MLMFYFYFVLFGCLFVVIIKRTSFDDWRCKTLYEDTIKVSEAYQKLIHDAIKVSCSINGFSAVYHDCLVLFVL